MVDHGVAERHCVANIGSLVDVFERKIRELDNYINTRAIFLDTGIEQEPYILYERLKLALRNWSTIEIELKKMEKKSLIQGSALNFVGAFGPNILFKVAVMFGKTSYGNPINDLPFHKQVTAALAWLGGGAKRVQGLGMTGGASVLSMVSIIPVLIGTMILIQTKEKEYQYLANLTQVMHKIDDHWRAFEMRVDYLIEKLKLGKLPEGQAFTVYLTEIVRTLETIANEGFVEVFKLEQFQ